MCSPGETYSSYLHLTEQWLDARIEANSKARSILHYADYTMLELQKEWTYLQLCRTLVRHEIAKKDAVKQERADNDAITG